MPCRRLSLRRLYLLLLSEAVLRASAFLNLGQLDYSNLGGHGPDTHKPRNMRYKDVAAAGGKFLDLLVETSTGYTPYDAAQNAASGKGHQVGSINIRLGTSISVYFKFVEQGSSVPASADRFFFTVYLSHKKERVRVHTNATGPAKSAGLSHFCVADGTGLDLQADEVSNTITFVHAAEPEDPLLGGSAGSGVQSKFVQHPSVSDPYELSDELRKQTFTLSFGNVSEFMLGVDIAGMVGEAGTNFLFSGTDSVNEYCLPWVGGDGLFYDYVEPGPDLTGPILKIVALVAVVAGLLAACVLLCSCLRTSMSSGHLRSFVSRENSLETRESSRTDSATPLIGRAAPKPRQLQVQATTEQWHVTVLKTAGREVGLRIKTLDDSLMVREITEGGLVRDWNMDIPGKEVKRDDFIIEVNGSKGTAEHLERALINDKALKLLIMRDAAKAAEVNSLDAADRTPPRTPTRAASSALVAVTPRTNDRKLADIKGEEKERLEGMLAKNEFQQNSRMLRRTKTLLSNVEGDLGNPRRQVELLEESLKELEEEVGPDDPEVAQLLTNLANAHASLGDRIKQKELLQRALAIKEKRFGPHDRRLAVTLTSLGDAHGALGEKEEQMATLERALDIKVRVYGPNHHEVAVTLANLGIAHRRANDPKQALELFERAVEIKEAEFGRDHPKVALTLGNMAQAHGDLGNHRTQRELLERSLHILETHYGPEHPHTALARQALGAVKQKSKSTVTPRNSP